MNESITSPFVSNRQMKQRQATMQMAQEVEQLFTRHQEQEGLTWKASKVDLMEMLYYVFETGSLHDEYGMLLSFSEIVRRGCELLHVVQPSNAYFLANRGRQRKGVKQLNFMERYLIMMEKQPVNTLWMNIG